MTLAHGLARTHGSRKRHRARRATVACTVLLCVLLAVAAVQSARLGMAGLIVELGQRELDGPGAPVRRPGMRELDRIAGYFSDSLVFFPHNPWALEGLGTLDLARMRVSATSRQAVAYSRQADAHFRSALRERPASPFLWANLALAKLYLDEFDAEFFSALRYADELAPWEPATQEIVLFAGLAAWPRLDAGLQASLARVVERGAARNGERLLAILKGYRRLDLACAVRSYDALTGTDCRQTPKAGAPGPIDRGKR